MQRKKLKEAQEKEKNEKIERMKRGPTENLTIAVLKLLLKDKGIAFSSKAKKSELVQIFNTQASHVTAYDGCSLKTKQFYFADKHPQKRSITTQSIFVSLLVSFIFRLVGCCSVVLLLNKELGKVKYYTIENHLYL